MNLGQIAKTILLPHENAPLRLPTFPNLERTAVCGFETNITTATYQHGLRAQRHVLHREPAAPLWIDQKVTDDDASRARYCYITGPLPAGHSVNPKLYYAGRLAPVGTAGGTEWMYFPCVFDGTNLTTQAMRVIAQVASTVSYTVLLPDGETKSETYTVPAGGTGYFLPLTAVDTCWVRLDSVEAAAATRLTVVPVAGAVCLWPAYSPPQVDISTSPYMSTRVTALSLLSTNVSRVQLKQGTITAARFSAIRPAFWSAVAADVAGVHPAERYYGAAENGSYVVAPPTQDSEEFRDTVRQYLQPAALSTTGVVSGATQGYNALVNNDTDDPFLFVLVEQESNVLDETLMALTVDIHLEFRTSSPLFQVGISTIPLEQYHAAQMVIAQAGYFYENQTHWWDLAGKIAGLAARVIPILFPTSRAATVVGAVARAGKILMNPKPPRRDMSQKQMLKPSANKPTRVKRAARKRQGKKS